MIRLTVEQLMALRDSLQRTGQVQCVVMPLFATASRRLIVAWAKGRGGEEYYLSVWKDNDHLQKAMDDDRDGVPSPFDFEQAKEEEMTHTYPVPVVGMQLDNTGRPYKLALLPSGRIKYTDQYVSEAGSGE